MFMGNNVLVCFLFHNLWSGFLENLGQQFDGFSCRKPQEKRKFHGLHYCWWLKSGVHQLRLVVYPISCRVLYVLHPWKLTCPLKSDYFSRGYIFQPLIFKRHVSFQGSIHPNWFLWDFPSINSMNNWKVSASTSEFSLPSTVEFRCQRKTVLPRNKSPPFTWWKTPQNFNEWNLNISVSWNSNDPCFDWKRPCFGGLTFKNSGHFGSRFPSKDFFFSKVRCSGSNGFNFKGASYFPDLKMMVSWSPRISGIWSGRYLKYLIRLFLEVGFPTHKPYPYGFYRRGFLDFRYQRNVWWFMVLNPGIHHVHGFLHPIHHSMRKWSNSTSIWFQIPFGSTN